jgi:hypothetical protein
VAVREAERLAAVGKLSDSGRLDAVLMDYEAESLRYELSAYGGSQNTNLVANMLQTVTPERVDRRIEIELANEPSNEYIARLEPRSRQLFVRELFGHAASISAAVAGA